MGRQDETVGGREEGERERDGKRDRERNTERERERRGEEKKRREGDRGGGEEEKQSEREALTGVSTASSVGDAEDVVLQNGLVGVVVQVDLGVDEAGVLHHPDPHQVSADVKVVHEVTDELQHGLEVGEAHTSGGVKDKDHVPLQSSALACRHQERSHCGTLKKLLNSGPGVDGSRPGSGRNVKTLNSFFSPPLLCLGVLSSLSSHLEVRNHPGPETCATS